MFRNHLKIAWRNLTKNRLHTGINIFCLAIGTVSCLTILLYVFDQTGYDNYHDNAESVYRIRTIIQGKNGADDFDSGTSSPPIAFAMKEDFPEVVEACRIVGGNSSETPIRSLESNVMFYPPRAYTSDSTIFNIFTYHFIEGNAESALKDHNTLVLSSSLANKLFTDQKALNRIVVLGTGEDAQKLTVSGVFDENFGKSHLNPDYIVTMDTPGMGEFVKTTKNFAAQNFVYSYVRLLPGTNPNQLEEKLPAFLQSHGGKDLAEMGMDKTLLLQKITDIHLYSKGIQNQIDAVSSIDYLYFLLILALFIQLIACVNFVNLSTAQGSKRSKGIAVAKVIGADKSSLVRQFLGESIFLSLFAVIISVPITIAVLPLVNDITQGGMVWNDLLNWKIIFTLMGLGLFTGIVAGAYPAMVLSAVKPIKVIRNSRNTHTGNISFRKTLVVFQFVISIGLIASVLIITQQFKYTQNKNLGFNKEGLIMVRLNSQNAVDNFNNLKGEYSKLPGVKGVAGTRFSPVDKVLSDFGLYLPGQSPQKRTRVKANRISKGYFKTMGIPIIQGRDLRDNDENQVIVNESTLRAFNIDKDHAINSKLLSTYEGETQEFQIVGVVSDYNYASLKDPIEPLMLSKSSNLNWMILRTSTSNYQSLLTYLKEYWKNTVSDVPFTYAFVDQRLKNTYEEDIRLREIISVFTFLAILISCLGLFGLVSFVAQQRRKEIGIRKVLGASMPTIIKLLTRDFVKLVGIAFIIASPIAWFLMQRWLENYAYRIDIHWWVFTLAGASALIIALLTVSFHAVKAAVMNPAGALRSE